MDPATGPQGTLMLCQGELACALFKASSQSVTMSQGKRYTAKLCGGGGEASRGRNETGLPGPATPDPR